MEMLSLNTNMGEVSFNYKAFLKWISRVAPFVLLSYAVAFLVLGIACYVGYDDTGIHIDTSVCMVITAMFGAVFAVAFNHKNMEWKAILSYKASTKFKKSFRTNLVIILVVVFLYQVLLKYIDFSYMLSNFIRGNTFDLTEPNIPYILIDMMIPPDVYTAFSMIGVFLVYSFTRYLFDKTAIAPDVDEPFLPYVSNKLKFKVLASIIVILFVWIYSYTCNFSHQLGAEFANPINVLFFAINNTLQSLILPFFSWAGIAGHLMWLITFNVLTVFDILIVSFWGASFLNKTIYGQGFSKKHTKNIANIYTLILMVFMPIYHSLSYWGFDYRTRSTEIIGIPEVVALFSLVMFFLAIHKANNKATF